VRQEFGRLDPPDRVFDQMTEFLALLVGDRGVEVLNFNQPLADEYDLGNLGNACHPGIANQLWVEGQQSLRFVRVAAGGGLPLEQAAGAVELADGIHVGHEVVLPAEGPRELDLQVTPRLADANPIALGEAIEQLHTLPDRLSA